MKKDIQRYLIDEFKLTSLKEVQVKNYIHVYQVKRSSDTFCLKYFERPSDAREIKCYKVLSDLGIATINFYEFNLQAIVLEDMIPNKKYRLGQAKDFADLKIAESVAHWFKRLHQLKQSHFMAFDFLNEEVIAFTDEDLRLFETHYEHSPFLDLLSQNKDLINCFLKEQKRVISHGDFYYKNFFIDQESNEVLMFDFNYMSKSLVSQELSLIRRNLRSESEKSEEAFMKAYGSYNKDEYQIYEIFRHFTWLIGAKSKELFPDWALESEALYRDGTLYNQLSEFLSNYNLREE